MTAATPDMLGPAARMRPRPSVPLAARLPSPTTAPGKPPPPFPLPLRAAAGNAPLDWLARLIPHSSAPLPHTPPQSLPASAPPASQTVHGYTPPAHMSASGSSRTGSVAAPLRSTVAPAAVVACSHSPATPAVVRSVAPTS